MCMSDSPLTLFDLVRSVYNRFMLHCFQGTMLRSVLESIYGETNKCGFRTSPSLEIGINLPTEIRYSVCMHTSSV